MYVREREDKKSQRESMNKGYREPSMETWAMHPSEPQEKRCQGPRRVPLDPWGVRSEESMGINAGGNNSANSYSSARGAFDPITRA